MPEPVRQPVSPWKWIGVGLSIALATWSGAIWVGATGANLQSGDALTRSHFDGQIEVLETTLATVRDELGRLRTAIESLRTVDQDHAERLAVIEYQLALREK